MSMDWRAKTFWNALEWNAKERGDSLAIVAGGERLSFVDLAERARSFGRGLLEAGIRPGDRVAVWSADCIEWLIARWAIPAVGAVLVPINTRFRTEEIRFILQQSEAAALIMSPGFANIGYYSILESVEPELSRHKAGAWESDVLPELKIVIGIGSDMPESVVPMTDIQAIGDRLVEKDNLFADAASAVDAEHIAQIMYTSGTTSFPKGAQVKHGALLQNNFNTIARMRLGAGDRYLATVPLFSATGTSFTLSPFLAGAPIVLMEGGFSAQKFCEVAESESITMSFYLEPIVKDLQAFGNLGNYDLSRLRTGTGAPLTHESFSWLVNDLGVEHLTNVYGLSETSNAVCRSFWNDPLETRLETCGPPMPNVEIRVADAESGEPLPQGEMGEIHVRAYTVTPGYFNMPEETAKSITPEGWLKTGDLGILRDDGQLIFKGRLKEMIKPNGFNVATLEVEDFIKRIPGVREVAVVGVPDDRMGEVGYAYIQTDSGATVDKDAVFEHCNAKIAGYKIPRYVSFVDEWPMTGSGKIKKLELKEQAALEIRNGAADTQARTATLT